MKRLKIIIIALALLFVGAYTYDVVFYGIGQNEKPKVSNTSSEVKLNPPTRVELLKLVNDERAKYGAVLLKEDPRFDATAQWKAEDMNSRQYFAHEDPKTGRRNGLDKMIETTGQFCSYVSENIYWGNSTKFTSKEALKWWMNSKSHREAILNTQYSITGFGISGNNVVEHFCITN